MDENKEIENGASDTFNTFNASTITTPKGEKHEKLGQNGQMVSWVDVSCRFKGQEVGVSQSYKQKYDKKVENACNHQSREIHPSYHHEANYNQRSTSKKRADEGMKRNIIQEVAHKLQVIKRIYDGAIETQKQSLQLELEYIGSKIQQLELELKALKTLGQQVSRKIPVPNPDTLLKDGG